MLQNAKVAAFTVPELLREKQQGGREEGLKLFPSPRLGLKNNLLSKIYPFIW